MFLRSSIRGLRCSTGPAAPKRRAAAGFTLMEILAVLAIIGLISALLIGTGGEYLRTMARDDVETVTLNAIASARHSSVLTGRELELRYDEKTRQLDWGEGQTVLVGAGEMRLLPPARVSSMLVGGREVEKSLARVRFYADGTCDPFRLEIVRDHASQLLTIDPWTCTMLSPEAASGGHN
jgi:prepilin-type N-terminal cleavage/methylation domain-containing protein